MSMGYPKDEDELDDIFGKPDRQPHRPHLYTEPAPSLVDELPTAEEMSQTQYEEAVNKLHEDTTEYPQFPWHDLSELAGPMCPEDLVLVAARTGQGKSLFLQNLFDAMIAAGRFGLYCGLEQTPRILRIKWACMRAGVAPRLVLATRKEERNGPAWNDAMKRVQDELVWARSPEIRARAHFAATRKIDKRGLKAWTEWAIEHGCEFVVIDHVDRIQHGKGVNPFQELSETIQLAKELAVEHRIVMLMATQVGRPADALEQFMPPALHNLRGAGTKEEEADTVLGIYRPLKADATDEQLKRVRQGLMDRDMVIEPNTMGIQVLKHRLEGPVAGKMVKLTVDRGRVLDMAPRDHYGTSYHEIKRI